MARGYRNNRYNRDETPYGKPRNQQRHNQGHRANKSNYRKGKGNQLDEDSPELSTEIQALVNQIGAGSEAVQALQMVGQGFPGHAPNIRLPSEAVQKFRMIVQTAHHTMAHCVAQLQQLTEVEFLPVEMDWEPEPATVLYRGPSLMTQGSSLVNPGQTLGNPGPSLLNPGLKLTNPPPIPAAPYKWGSS